MNITDELERLDKLHKDGALSDEEFSRGRGQPAKSARGKFDRRIQR